ncbi:MAG: hypothetical protein JXA73_21855 [Acidobacteria bacterium]|nr:hypothetical protein [Acidobacteriota bacterium]
MKQAILAALIIFALCDGNESFGAEPRFIKISDHCYYMQMAESGENIAAVVTDDGVLLVNPPPEPELSIAVDALKKIASKAVRWVVFTDPGLSQDSQARFFSEGNTLFLGTAKFRALSKPKSANKDVEDNESAPAPAPAWLLFERQMRLFPSNLEIRIIALQHKARTGADIIVFIPAEKVLFAGRLYEAARYPDIDADLEGSAIGWLDGIKQIIDAVPLLKTAIPQVRPDPKSEKEKTLEENVIILSSRGETSNLQNMKDLLESSRKLHSDISRSIRRGRTCDDFLTSPASDPYRSYANLHSFATHLFAE